MEPIKYAKKVDYQSTMDYKGEQIARAQNNKENSIRISSSGRDAVIITTTFYKNTFYKNLKDEEIKSKILEWRKWLFENVYSDDLSVPF